VAVKFENDAFTPAEAQGIALRLADHFEAERYRVKLEKALQDDAPYRTTLLASLADLALLIEVQRTPSFTDDLQQLSIWLDQGRIYAQLYLAIEPVDDAPLSGRMIQQLRRQGIGLMLVDPDGSVDISFEAPNPALIVTPDPTLPLGSSRSEMNQCVRRFNSGDRKAALRDLFEMVERENRSLGVRAAKKGWIDRSEAQVSAMDWSNTINVLSSVARVAPGKTLIISPKLKDDLHSFRGARNLVDHPPANKREDIRRQRQFSERMMSGPRLLAELLTLKRRVT